MVDQIRNREPVIEGFGEQVSPSLLEADRQGRRRPEPRPAAPDPADRVLTQQRQQLYQQTAAAVMFQFARRSGGFDWAPAVRPITEKFLNMVGNDPTMAAKIAEDVNTLWALTDLDIAERIAAGESPSQFGDVFDAIADIAWEVGAQETALKMAAQSASAVRQTYEALAETGPLAEDQSVLFGRLVAAGLKAGLLVGRDGAWSWNPEANLLAVTTADGLTVAVRPRPGFTPSSPLDVLTEVAVQYANGGFKQDPQKPSRLMEKVEEIGRYVDSRPGLADTLDTLWNGLVRTWLPFAPLNPLAQAAEMREERRLAAVQRIESAPPLDMPEELFIARLAEQMVRQAGEAGPVRAVDALAEAASIVEENREQLLTEWDQLTREQLIEEVEQQFEEKSVLGQAIDETLGSVLDVFETWEAVTQTIAVNLIDFGLDMDEAFDNLFALGVGDTSLAEGFDALRRAFTELPDLKAAPTVGDYFELQGSAYDLANLASSIFFDPINIAGPGAKGAKALFYRAMTDPKYVTWYLRAPLVQSITREIASENVGRAIKNVLYLDGLSVDGYRQLLRVAKDTARSPEAQQKIVESVLEAEIRNGVFLGAGPHRAIRQSTVEGFGRIADLWASGKLSGEQTDLFLSLFAQLNRTRHMSVAENVGLSNFFDLLHQFHPNNPEKMVEWATKALDAVESGPTREAVQGVLTATKQDARRAIRKVEAIDRHVTANLEGIEANILTTSQAVRQVDELPIDDAAKEQLRRQLAVTRGRLERARTRLESTVADLDASRREAHRKIGKAHRAENDLAVNNARTALAEVTYRLYDDIAQQINKEAGEDLIPILRDGRGAAMPNPLAPDVPLRDWSAVTGTKVSPLGRESLPVVLGLAGDHADLAGQLTEIGMFRRAQKVILPASPYEVVMFQKLLGNKAALAAWRQKLRAGVLGRSIRGMKLLFGVNLLMNPVTAGKVTLDETLRFMVAEGAATSALKATLAGMPGAEAAYRSLADGLRQIPGMKRVLSDDFGEWVTNPYALQAGRGHAGFVGDDVFEWVSIDQTGRAPWRMAPAEYAQHAERWVNGTLLQDPLFRRYAQFIDDAVRAPGGRTVAPDRFVKWWEEGLPEIEGGRPGYTYARTSELVVGKETVLVENAADVVWDRIDRAFGFWLDEWVKPNQRNQLRRRLLKAAAGVGEPLKATGSDAHLLKAIQRIPAPIEGGRPTGVGTLLGRGFEVGFGGPSRRRGGVFFEYYFDEAMDMYRKRFEGRIITAEKISEAAGVSIGEARKMLRDGADNAVVAELVRNRGMVTERWLETAAARYAGARADDLMFRFTATSMIGQGLEAGLLFPFARAQVDFVSWWFKHLTRPMRLRPQLAEFLPEKLTGTVERLPLNLRAISRYAHLNATVNNDEPSLFDQAVDKLTFFPTNWSNEFLIDLLPQPGPLPAWMIDQAGASGKLPPEVMASLEDVFPALGFTDESVGLFDRIVAPGRRSLRKQLWAATQAVASVFGHDPTVWGEGKASVIYNYLGDGRLPPAYGDFAAAGLAEWLEANAFTVAAGTAEADAALTGIAIDAGLKASQTAALTTLKDVVSPFAAFTKEFQALKAYAPLFEPDTFDLLEAAGVLSGSDLFDVDGQPRIRAVWERFEAGTASEEDRKYLADALKRIYDAADDVPLAKPEGKEVIFTLRDWLNITSPGIAVNLVSKNACSEAPVRSPEHRQFHTRYCDAQTGRLQNIPPGDAGAQLIRTARLRGWIESRPPDGPDGWGRDAHEAVLKSARDAVGAAWFWVTGRTWAQGSKKSIDPQTITITSKVARVLNATGLDVEEGQQMTVAEYREMLAAHRTRFKNVNGPGRGLIESGPFVQQLASDPTGTGSKLLSDLKEAADFFEDNDIYRFDDWPESVKEKVRARIREMVTLGVTTVDDYQQNWEELFGPIDYEPPDPPPVDQLDFGIALTPQQVSDGTVEVLDGDTISLLTADGPLRIRLIGINAPEMTQDGGPEATSNLIDLLNNAESVVLGFYKPELFGITQRTSPSERRLFAWLYVDGVPIWDPSVFTSSNPRGAGVGGTVLDLAGILSASKAGGSR